MLRPARCSKRSSASPRRCGAGDLLDGGLEGGFVGLGGLGETAQLADELERRVAHLVLRRRRLEVEEGLDVTAHGESPDPLRWRRCQPLNRSAVERWRASPAHVAIWEMHVPFWKMHRAVWKMHVPEWPLHVAERRLHVPEWAVYVPKGEMDVAGWK